MSKKLLISLPPCFRNSSPFKLASCILYNNYHTQSNNVFCSPKLTSSSCSICVIFPFYPLFLSTVRRWAAHNHKISLRTNSEANLIKASSILSVLKVLYTISCCIVGILQSSSRRTTKLFLPN